MDKTSRQCDKDIEMEVIVPSYSELKGRKRDLSLEDILNDFQCPLCHEILVNTHTMTACLHRFCEGCIESWFRTTGKCSCPACGIKSPPFGCLPDIAFESLLIKLLGEKRKRVKPKTAQPVIAQNGGIANRDDIITPIDIIHPQSSAARTKRTYWEVNNDSGPSSRTGLCPNPNATVRTLRPPAAIIKILPEPSISSPTIWPVKFIACPLKRTVLDLKRAILRGISEFQFDNRAPLGPKDDLNVQIRLKLRNKIRSSQKANLETDQGLRDTLRVEQIVDILDDDICMEYSWNS